MGTFLSPVLREARPGVLEHWCPGCNARHQISVGEANASGAKWAWNSSADAPSFQPSVHILIGPWDDDEGHHPKRTVCHYFLTDGRLHFLTDSAHALAGQTVDLPWFPKWAR